ncbi:GFA family protein [Steroidobacter sp. S1-65]|uniref:GFA family protein n=1 Tax=Steroidobacter gossypii TaxID=2805490 RepID=A0ABS1X6H4_9GAMM|nr:GFA family protein [Steroidobacter gossypii]MBM0108805.1 GFA family protein [Steroidobacter gossypii]
MTTRLATCNCGQLKVHATGEPIRISVCHCLACQRRSGSVFAMQARFERPNVRIEGTAKQWVRITDSGNQCIQHFCPECGSTVYYQVSTAPDVFAVPVGAFADPSFPEPKFSVYEERKHSWVQMPASAERSH